MTKKIAVIAVRVAVEIDDDQGILPAIDSVRHVLNRAEEESHIFTWDFDEWGVHFDESHRHVFEVADAGNGHLPQIRGRAVTLV